MSNRDYAFDEWGNKRAVPNGSGRRSRRTKRWDGTWGDLDECQKCHETFQPYDDRVHGVIEDQYCWDCHERVYPGELWMDDEDRKVVLASCGECHNEYVAWDVWPPPPVLHFGVVVCPECHHKWRLTRATLEDLAYVRKSLGVE